MNTQAHGDSYEDDCVTFEAIDEIDNHLSVRVGSVFYANANPEQHPEKGIWILLNDECILLSRETFKALISHINKRFEH